MMPELEDSQYWPRNFERNQQWVRPGTGSYNTQLSSDEEKQFRGWLKDNKVPFQADEPVTDYDMRGFWRGLQAGNPIAQSAVDPNDKLLHYPDFWKTPYSATFSAESQWANPNTAPRWLGDNYVLPNGTVLWDDKAQKWVGPEAPWSPSDRELLQTPLPR
jgi:hypothetical protein